MRRTLDTRWAIRGMATAPRRTWPLAVLMMAVLLVPAEGASYLPQPDGTTLALRLARALGAGPAAAAPTYRSTPASDVAPWWQRTVHDADRDGMFDQLDRLVDSGSREPVDVLVDVDSTPTEAGAIALASRVGAEGWGIFPVLQVVGLRAVPPSMLPTLARVPGVLMLEPRMDPVPLMDIATPAIKARESDVYGPENAWALGAKGDGVNIAIMDTGIDDSHPALVGKWVAGADFTNPKWLPIRGKRDGTWNADDAAGHGTTCAGIATSTGAPDGTYVGAAPDARLVDLRIGTPLGFSPGEGPQNFYDAALEAEDWAAANADTQWAGGAPPGIDIISLSWGIPYDGPSDGSDAYSRGLDACIQRGIQVANAAGNDGPDNVGLTGMSASGMSTIVAALDDLNTVDRSDDIIADYSSRGPRDDNGDGYPYDELKPDISAPGTNINGVVFERVGDGSGGGYGGRGSGTSYATPYIAGISALLLSVNHDLPPLILREVLRATAERRGTPEYPDIDPYWDREFGWGMVDAYNATRVVLEIDDLGAIDVELQAFPTNITGGNAAAPVIVIDGLAWARVGNVANVEWRVDNGSWHSTEIDAEGAWNVKMGPADLGVGTHTFESRAVGDDGKHSVWRPVELNVTTEAAAAKGTPSGSWLWYVAGVAAVTVVALFVMARRPKLARKVLGALHVHKPSVTKPATQPVVQPAAQQNP